MLEYVALDTVYFVVIEPILMFFYESHQKSDGFLRGSLVKYVNVLGKRDDHASEMIRNPPGLPSITYCNNKKEDIEITILALQTTCPSIMLK
jgi:hypothetical protein